MGNSRQVKALDQVVRNGREDETHVFRSQTEAVRRKKGRKRTRKKTRRRRTRSIEGKKQRK